MATGTAALAEKLTKGKSKDKKPSSTKSKKEKSLSIRSRSDVPWQKIADLYNKGLSTAEISDQLGLTRTKNKKGKENPYPYYLVVGYLTKLSHGVEINGHRIQIKRGNRKKSAKK